MRSDELKKGIEAKFDQSRIVFWYDPEESFHEEFAELSIDDVVIVDMENASRLEIKKRIELDLPKQRFLLYFHESKPDPENDWLLDIGLYSEQFFADHSSILLNELGIGKMSLRSHIGMRHVFFANKQRLAGLKKWVTENEDELSLDRKMIAVVLKAESASMTDILLSLLRHYAETLDSNSAGRELAALAQLKKFNLIKPLWTLLTTYYGYGNSNPSLPDFLLALFCTELWSQIEGDDRDWMLNNVLQRVSGRATALAFMAGWRDSRNFARYYDSISQKLAEQLAIAHKYAHYLPIQLIECETFISIENIIVRGLVSQLLDPAQPVDRSQFERILSRRLTSHWSHSETRHGKQYTAIYDAIRHAELLKHLRAQYTDGFHYQNAQALYDAYVNELYQFEQSYRLFNEHAHSVHGKRADILRPLDDQIEKLYTHWYLNELSLAWDNHLANEGLLENWALPDVPLQCDFYADEVARRISSKQTRRMFVIVSDALRFEIAKELSQVIDSEKRFKIKMSSQLGVLPSYTQLGMAALLPHKELSYQSSLENKGQGTAVLVDGQSSQGLDKRNAILEKVNGMAVSAKELMSWTSQKGRNKVRDASVVYIYHDTIDAIGDNLATEEKTFEACRTAINELKDLVGRVINGLNASKVLLTADHGFLFQQQALATADKTVLRTKPSGAIEAKKRYIIGENLPFNDACWKGRIANTANGTGDIEFLLPKGAQRFHFVGGARFVHGGALLQEVCIPVLEVSALRGEKMKQHEKQPAGVVVATQPIKIVTNIDKIRFIQADPVGEKFVARKLAIFIEDGERNEVSSREIVNFDSQSKLMDERSREVKLKLIGTKFDPKAQYTLILENTHTRVRYSQYAVIIDLAFEDDFFGLDPGTGATISRIK